MSGTKSKEDRSTYYRLLSSATRVEILQKAVSEEESYFNAGKRVVDLADFVVAVWDGKPAVGLGGTGDVVNYTRKIDRQVYHLNPILRKVTV